MSKRALDSKIRKSQSFAKLTYRQRDLWQGIIAIADDQGRMPGDSRFISSQVWPYDGVSAEEVELDLERLIDMCMVYRYQVEEDLYIQIVNWWKYQSMNWAGSSGFPAPEGWIDRLRYHGKENKIIILNWNSPGGFISTPPPGKQDSEPVIILSSELPNPLSSPLHSGLSTPLPSRDVNGDVNDDDDVKTDSRGRLFSLYENEIGLLTPMISEQIIDWIANYPEQWVEEAITLAVQANVRKLKYISAILRNWQKDGRGDLSINAQGGIPISEQLKREGFTNVRRDSG